MAIELDTLCLMAREQLTELPESVMFSRENMYALVPPAVALWQTETNDDPARRHPFIKESGPITIVNNSSDIADEVQEKGYRLDFIKDSDIEIPLSDGAQKQLTVKFVPSLDRLKLTGRADKFFVLAYLSGTKIRFQNTAAVSFKIRSSVIPSALEDLPVSIMPELSTVMADLARRQIREKALGANYPAAK